MYASEQNENITNLKMDKRKMKQLTQTVNPKDGGGGGVKPTPPG